MDQKGELDLLSEYTRVALRGTPRRPLHSSATPPAMHEGQPRHVGQSRMGCRFRRMHRLPHGELLPVDPLISGLPPSRNRTLVRVRRSNSGGDTTTYRLQVSKVTEYAPSCATELDYQAGKLTGICVACRSRKRITAAGHAAEPGCRVRWLELRPSTPRHTGRRRDTKNPPPDGAQHRSHPQVCSGRSCGGLVILTGCSNDSKTPAATPTTRSAPSSASSSPTPSPSTDPQAAEKAAALDAYSRFWAEQVKAYAKGDTKGTDFRRYAGAKALVSTETDLTDLRSKGIVTTGAPPTTPRSTRSTRPGRCLAPS